MNTDDDILIAGTTDYDNIDTALCSIMAEWTSGRDYATRVHNLDGTAAGTRLNGQLFLKVDSIDGGAVVRGTVHDDGPQDILTGSEGQDWFIFNADGESGSVKDKGCVEGVIAVNPHNLCPAPRGTHASGPGRVIAVCEENDSLPCPGVGCEPVSAVR